MITKKEYFDGYEIAHFDSSNLSRCAYYPDEEELIIFFHKGGSYLYKPIDQKFYNRFLNSESQGRFFNDYFKKNDRLIVEKIMDNHVLDKKKKESPEQEKNEENPQ